jgi:hypothetical protein
MGTSSVAPLRSVSNREIKILLASGKIPPRRTVTGFLSAVHAAAKALTTLEDGRRTADWNYTLLFGQNMAAARSFAMPITQSRMRRDRPLAIAPRTA